MPLLVILPLSHIQLTQGRADGGGCRKFCRKRVASPPQAVPQASNNIKTIAFRSLTYRFGTSPGKFFPVPGVLEFALATIAAFVTTANGAYAAEP
jgi:hypothetical protein